MEHQSPAFFFRPQFCLYLPQLIWLQRSAPIPTEHKEMTHQLLKITKAYPFILPKSCMEIFKTTKIHCIFFSVRFARSYNSPKCVYYFVTMTAMLLYSIAHQPLYQHQSMGRSVPGHTETIHTPIFSVSPVMQI